MTPIATDPTLRLPNCWMLDGMTSGCVRWPTSSDAIRTRARAAGYLREMAASSLSGRAGMARLQSLAHARLHYWSDEDRSRSCAKRSQSRLAFAFSHRSYLDGMLRSVWPTGSRQR